MTKAGTKIFSSFSVHKNCPEIASAFKPVVITAKKLILKEQTGSGDEDESSENTYMYYVNDVVHG